MIDLEKLLSLMTLDEKISMLAGKDRWHTVSVPCLGNPLHLNSFGRSLQDHLFFKTVEKAVERSVIRNLLELECLPQF